MNMSINSMQLEELTGDERTLVVVALQALHRERLTASNAVFTVCSLAGKEQPPEDIFGLREVQDALRRLGAAPAR
ncbi:hypothetical protein AZZ64_004699 [Enterobacter cloacae]|uniref:hypothetical protein n=2 Tax=Enterobacter cloacae TaxID=550 RepID=UPI000B63B883|nr:hypothetical protein [Enterobacter cloacae]OUF32433.1 hypothetical protein AZZ64_004699 [Enterobacter cloacae]